MTIISHLDPVNPLEVLLSPVNENFGSSIVIQDRNHDDIPDLIIGAHTFDDGASGLTDNGKIYVIDGANLANQLEVISGTSNSQKLGGNLLIIDDYTGDGKSELVVGVEETGAIPSIFIY